jgi:hypothetical protein
MAITEKARVGKVSNREFQRLTSNPTLAAASLTSNASGTLVASINQLITGLISTQPRFKPKMVERTSDMLAKMNASIIRGFPKLGGFRLGVLHR